jgi:hypothetical protein
VLMKFMAHCHDRLTTRRKEKGTRHLLPRLRVYHNPCTKVRRQVPRRGTCQRLRLVHVQNVVVFNRNERLVRPSSSRQSLSIRPFRLRQPGTAKPNRCHSDSSVVLVARFRY